MAATTRQIRPAASQSGSPLTRGVSAACLAAVMAAGLMLSGCNTTAGAGRDVSATGAAVTRGAQDVAKGL